MYYNIVVNTSLYTYLLSNNSKIHQINNNFQTYKSTKSQIAQMRKAIISIIIISAIIMSGCTQLQAGNKDTYTTAEIAEHNTETDCWLLIDEKVYDATDYIASHPGGTAMLQGCGTDATKLFRTRPMGSKTPHSDNAEDLLKDYYIGSLE